MSNSPFITKKVTCPSCHKSCGQNVFRRRMFLGEQKESDQHVLKYKWLNDSVERVHPPHYFIYLCPHCLYADTAESYSNPTASETTVFAVKAFRNMNRPTRALVEFLGEHINYGDIDFESAMNLHFLALFIHTLPDRDMQNPYKLARLLLRIAWLYREQAPHDDGSRRIASVDETLTALSSVAALIGKLHKSWVATSEAIQRRREEVKDTPAAGQYEACRAGIEASIGKLVAQTRELNTLCRQDLLGNADSETPGGEGYYEFKSYDEFFAKAKIECPILPSDEIEAMRAALEYFEIALSSDARFDNPTAQFNVVSLMADLCVRCGDIDRAFGMVRGMYKSAIDARVSSQRRLREDPDLTDAARTKLGSEIRRATASLGKAGDLRRELLDKLVDQEMPKIRKVFEQHPAATDAQLAEELTQTGVAPGLLNHIKEQGGLKKFMKKDGG